MISKGSQRANGQELATHLMNTLDNEHVELHELRGFASSNLGDAFKEVEAISRATKCKQYLFSLSINPPSDAEVSVEDFETAISTVEDKLGLTDQPRAIVFHEKENRRHAHVCWSRIDGETLTAKPMSFYKNKLQEVSRELYLENGWKLPDGLRNHAERNPINFNLAEWQQAKRQEIDPRWLKQALQECWQSSDDLKSLKSALEEKAFFLAKGDRRSYVVLDYQGEVWSLPRMLGVKTKIVKDRLGKDADLPSVDETKQIIGKQMTPAILRHLKESRSRYTAVLPLFVAISS